MSYARGTLAALVDAVVPETPELADRGEEHVPGGLAVGLDETLREAFDGLQSAEGTPLSRLGYDSVPYSPVVAALFDLAALELLARRRNEESLRAPAGEFARGPFSRLSRRDRLRAVRLLEEDGLLARLDDRFHDRVPHLGVAKYLVQGVLTVTQLAYYSEWADDDYPPQGWEQTGYPGPADGYAVSMGYEVEAFEEDEY